MTDPTGFVGATDATTNSITGAGLYNSTAGWCSGDCVVTFPNGRTNAQLGDGVGNYPDQGDSTNRAGQCYPVKSSSAGTGGSGDFIRPTPPNWFTDSIAGNIASDTIGKAVALFGDRHVNPLSGELENFDGDNRAIAVIGIGSNFFPVAGQEKRAATLGEAILSFFNPCKCFVAGTPVQTSHGLKPIEKIQVGDYVTARDEATGEVAWKPVLRVIRNGEKDVLRVQYIDENGKRESLGVTPEHPFMLEGMHWVEAGKVVSGDKIMRLNGGLLTVEKISKYKVRHHTYNLEVADFHTYFVGTMGVWVHNTNCDLSTALTSLYQKIGPDGEHLKFGIAKDPATRYTLEELGGGRLKILATGIRSEMLKLERALHETLPIGPEEGQKFYIQKQIDKGLIPPPYKP